MDEAGGRALRVDALGWPTTYTLDALERATTRQYRGGTRATFTFDLAGKQTTMQDVTGVATNLWDNAGRQIGVVNGAGKALTYTLDPTGNRIGMVDSDGGLTTYTHDQQNRLTGIVNPYNEITTMLHDALGREQKKTLGNGMIVSQLYDAVGREISLWNVSGAGVGLAIYTASYDAVGNRLNNAEMDGTRVTWAYDPSNQLVNEQRSGANAYNTTYLYDPVGNRTLKNDSGALTSYSYNAANELTLMTPPTGQPTTSLWDANGNLSLENAGGQLTSYSWDGENRLTGVAYPAGAPDTMSYSADGLRQKKVTGSGTIGFVWDERNVLLETDASGLTQAHYTDHPGMWGGLASQRRSGASSFFGFDQQANSRVLVTSAGGPSDSYLYGAFGEELSVSGSTVNALRFGGMVGYYRDLAARLYVRARHYEPAVGRWISRDPLGFLGGDWNLYGYGRGRPTVLIDPTGAQIPIACIGCAACVGTIIIASLFACYGSPIGFLECLQCWLDDHPWAYAVLIGCAVVCAVCIPVPVPTPVPVPIPTPVPVPVGAPAMAALSSGAARLGDRPYPWSDDGGFGDLARAPCKRLLRRCVCENWWTDQDCGNCYRYCRHYNCWPWQKCHPRFGGY